MFTAVSQGATTGERRPRGGTGVPGCGEGLGYDEDGDGDGEAEPEAPASDADGELDSDADGAADAFVPPRRSTTVRARLVRSVSGIGWNVPFAATIANAVVPVET